MQVDKMTGGLSRRPLAKYPDRASRGFFLQWTKWRDGCQQLHLQEKKSRDFLGHMIVFFASGQIGVAAVKSSTCRNTLFVRMRPIFCKWTK